MNAKTFIKEQAQRLEQRGYSVQWTNEVTEYGSRSLSFLAMRGPFDNAISAHASQPLTSRRWKFHGVRIYRFMGETLVRRTYAKARTAIEVYAL